MRLSSDAFERSADELAGKLDVWLGETVSALRGSGATIFVWAAIEQPRPGTLINTRRARHSFPLHHS